MDMAEVPMIGCGRKPLEHQQFVHTTSLKTPRSLLTYSTSQRFGHLLMPGFFYLLLHEDMKFSQSGKSQEY
jgi:hypothetical protein